MRFWRRREKREPDMEARQDQELERARRRDEELREMVEVQRAKARAIAMRLVHGEGT